MKYAFYKNKLHKFLKQPHMQEIAYRKRMSFMGKNEEVRHQSFAVSSESTKEDLSVNTEQEDRFESK